MKNLKRYAFLVLFSLSLTFQSCNKDEDDKIIESVVDQELLIANAQIDFTNELDFNMGVDVASDYDSYYSSRTVFTSILPPCAIVSVDNATPGEFPKVFTIDFGTDCSYNGINRSGIITITLTDYFLNFGSQMTVERTNYFINGRKIEGTVVYENQTTNADIPKWSRTVSNGKLTALNGAVFTFSGTRTIQQSAGVQTLALSDNIYEVLSGTHTVTRPNGTSLTVTVLEKLIKKYDCTYISQGKLNLQGTYLNGVLDYGDTTCDNQATYTHSNGNIYNVTL